MFMWNINYYNTANEYKQYSYQGNKKNTEWLKYPVDIVNAFFIPELNSLFLKQM